MTICILMIRLQRFMEMAAFWINFSGLEGRFALFPHFDRQVRRGSDDVANVSCVTGDSAAVYTGFLFCQHFCMFLNILICSRAKTPFQQKSAVKSDCTSIYSTGFISWATERCSARCFAARGSAVRSSSLGPFSFPLVCSHSNCMASQYLLWAIAGSKNMHVRWKVLLGYRSANINGSLSFCGPVMKCWFARVELCLPSSKTVRMYCSTPTTLVQPWA